MTNENRQGLQQAAEAVVAPVRQPGRASRRAFLTTGALGGAALLLAACDAQGRLLGIGAGNPTSTPEAKPAAKPAAAPTGAEAVLQSTATKPAGQAEKPAATAAPAAPAKPGEGVPPVAPNSSEAALKAYTDALNANTKAITEQNELAKKQSAATAPAAPTSAPAKPAAAPTGAPSASARGAETPVAVPAAQPGGNTDTFGLPGADGRFRLIRRQGAYGQIYDGIVSEFSPRDKGLPDRMPTTPMPSPQEFDKRPRWTAEEISEAANRNKYGILIPDMECWSDAEKWCKQTWAWSPAVGRVTDNFLVKTTGEPGRFSWQKIDMTKDGVIDFAVLMTDKDPTLNKSYMNDLRHGSFRPNSQKEVIKDADVFARFKGGRPGTTYFAYRPDTGEWIKRDGIYVQNVMSENSDGGFVLPIAANGQEAVAWAGRVDLKRDPLDAHQEIDVSFGPTAKNVPTKQNLGDLRDLGAK